MALPNILLHDPALEGLILDCQVIKIKNLQRKKVPEYLLKLKIYKKKVPEYLLTP
jgi:hypothetical protein